jgi:hypothetical protein
VQLHTGFDRRAQLVESPQLVWLPYIAPLEKYHKPLLLGVLLEVYIEAADACTAAPPLHELATLPSWEHQKTNYLRHPEIRGLEILMLSNLALEYTGQCQAQGFLSDLEG